MQPWLSSLLIKLGTALVNLISSIAGSFLPFLIFGLATLRKQRLGNDIESPSVLDSPAIKTTISCMNCLSAGFFIAAAFLQMLGAANLQISHVIQLSIAHYNDTTSQKTGILILERYPFPELVAVFAFLLPFVFQFLLTKGGNAKKEMFQTMMKREENAHLVNSSEETPFPIKENSKSLSSSDFDFRLLVFVVLCVLVTQSILVGIISGVLTQNNQIFSMLVAMTIHKFMAAFTLGSQLLRLKSRNIISIWWPLILILLFFAAMTPIGIVIGTVVNVVLQAIEKKHPTTWWLGNQIPENFIAGSSKALGCGFFMYVGFFGLIMDEFFASNTGENLKSQMPQKLLKLTCFFIGFFVIAALDVWFVA